MSTLLFPSVTFIKRNQKMIFFLPTSRCDQYLYYSFVINYHLLYLKIQRFLAALAIYQDFAIYFFLQKAGIIQLILSLRILLSLMKPLVVSDPLLEEKCHIKLRYFCQHGCPWQSGFNRPEAQPLKKSLLGVSSNPSRLSATFKSTCGMN